MRGEGGLSNTYEEGIDERIKGHGGSGAPRAGRAGEGGGREGG